MWMNIHKLLHIKFYSPGIRPGKPRHELHSQREAMFFYFDGCSPGKLVIVSAATGAKHGAIKILDTQFDAADALMIAFCQDFIGYKKGMRGDAKGALSVHNLSVCGKQLLAIGTAEGGEASSVEGYFFAFAGITPDECCHFRDVAERIRICGSADLLLIAVEASSGTSLHGQKNRIDYTPSF